MRLRRAVVALAVAAATVGVAVPAQAAVQAQGSGPAWSLTFAGLRGTPSPYDRVMEWTGECPTEGLYRVEMNKVIERGPNSVTSKPVSSGETVCTTDHTFRLEYMLYDYHRGNELPKGTEMLFHIRGLTVRGSARVEAKV